MDLSGANLCSADLREAELTWALLHGADLSHANLVGAKMKGALGSACLDFADLSRADMGDARLSGSSFVNAKLIDASIMRADLSSCDMRGADLTRALVSDNAGTATNFQSSNLRNTTFTREDNGRPEAGFLELATCKGLDSAEFEAPATLSAPPLPSRNNPPCGAPPYAGSSRQRMTWVLPRTHGRLS